MTTPHIDDDTLSAHLDAALDDAEARAVTTHLGGCADCGRRFDMLRATSYAVATLPASSLPRPLDFGFLAEAPAESERGRVVSIFRGRPPAWVAPVLAAAAVVVIAVGIVGPRLAGPAASSTALRAGLGGSAPTATSSGQPFDAREKTQDSGVPQVPGTLNGAAGPAAAPADLGQSSAHTFPDAAGLTVSIGTDQASVSRNGNLTVSMQTGGASADSSLGGPAEELILRGPGGDLQLASGFSDGYTLRAGQSIRLSAQTHAPATPGDYVLVARVRLTDGRILEASIALRVT